jgi:fused signal recognition particle receptor
MGTAMNLLARALGGLHAQTPVPLTAPTSGDLVGLLVMGGLALAFAVLAVLFVVKSRRKRIAELTEALERKPLLRPGEDEDAAEAEPEALPPHPPPPSAEPAVVTAAAERAVVDEERAVEPAVEPEIAAAEPVAAPEPRVVVEAVPEEDASTRQARLREGLTKTRGGLMQRLGALFGGGRQLDPALLDELEQILVTSDVGVKTAEHLLSLVRGKMDRKELADAAAVRRVLKAEIRDILQRGAAAVEPAGRKPFVVMVIGVNGGGKTTTVGKLAHRFAQRGHKVVLGAGDTFRAAAVDQLEVWAQRAGVAMVRGKEGQDPSSVLFEAVKRAVDEQADVVIADTAGRLHTKVNLMEELKKVQRVLGKACDGAPHEVLLVLDATTGQNAIAQAAQFSAAVPVSGVVLTKLDGTAKGGVIVGICKEFGIPVKFIGIGEKLADLRPFDAEDFVEALFEGN